MIRKFFLSFVAVLVVAGCATRLDNRSSNLKPQDRLILSLTQPELARKIKRGKTTQAEVIRMFGEPESTINKNEKETVFLYKAVETSAYGKKKPSRWLPRPNLKVVFLSVTFKNGVVKEYTMAVRDDTLRSSPSALS